jgi:hypothetical protein
MFIIKCFDIDSSRFLSRLALERNRKPGASLQVLRNPPSLLSLGQSSTTCVPKFTDATLFATVASKAGWRLSLAGFHTPSNIVGTSLCKPELNFLIALPFGRMSFTIVCTSEIHSGRRGKRDKTRTTPVSSPLISQTQYIRSMPECQKIYYIFCNLPQNL